MVDSGEAAGGACAPAGATPRGCRSPTARSTGSSPPRSSSTSSDDGAAIGELARVLRPGGTLAVTVPACLAERICWALSDEYHAPFVEGGHVRIYRESGCGRSCAAPGWPPGRPPRPRHPRPLLVAALRRRADRRRPPPGPGLPPGPGVGHRRHAALAPPHPAGRPPAVTGDGQEHRRLRPQARATPPREPGRRPRHRHRRDLQQTVDAIAEWQLPSGMIPWFPGGHADPWNHVEAAMALTLGGRHAEAEAAFTWLAAMQRPDGSWHQYYLADRVEQDKLDANVCAYVAAGVWHRWLCTEDRGVRRGPVAGRRGPSTSSSTCRRRGARSSGRATPTARRGRSPCSPARRRSATACAAPSPWPSCWATSGPTGSCPPPASPTSIRHVPEAFAPKHRWAMDWYYPVLAGVMAGDDGRARLASRYKGVRDRRAGRALRVRPALGHRRRDVRVRPRPAGRGQPEPWPRTCSAGRSSTAPTTGATGPARCSPTRARFPAGERSTYTASAVVLAADGLSGGSPASGLFTRHDEVLPVGFDAEEHPGGRPARATDPAPAPAPAQTRAAPP